MPQNNSASELRDNLISIENIKGDIRNSIANKGQSIDINTPFAEYSNLISNITTSENLDAVLNSQEQKLEELESALSGKTSDISYINFNAVVRPGLYGGGQVSTLMCSDYIETLPLWNFGVNPNYKLTLNRSFSDCNNLRTIPNWNIYSITSFEYTFANCTNLTEIPNWDMSNVTNMSYMFYNCNNLQNVPNLNTSKITNMSYVFCGCDNLVNAPNLDMSKTNTILNMFSKCTNLVNVPQYNTSNLQSLAFMGTFEKCNNLSDASIQNIINMCLMANLINSSTFKNLNVSCSYSPFNNTNITNDRYQNRWQELTDAGWAY